MVSIMQHQQEQATDPPKEVLLTLRGVYHWPAGEPIRSPLRYEGIDLSGNLAGEEARLPGFCLYYGQAPMAKALAADYRFATLRGRHAIEIVVKVGLLPGQEGSNSWELWGGGGGDLVDLRERRISRESSKLLQERFRDKKPYLLLAEQPQRVVEAAMLFPRAKVIVFRVNAKDGVPRPVAWLRSRAPVREIKVGETAGIDVDVRLPPPSWKGWR